MEGTGFARRAEQALLSPLAASIFAIGTILLGVLIAKDYGISWDEKTMYVLGEEVYEFVTRGEPYPMGIGIRFHGAWFEVLQHAVQKLLGLRYARDIFIARHLMNYGTFIVGMLSVYAIALHVFRHRGWAGIAMVMFFLSPRQFGHAFFNSRDIPAMSFFALKMLTLFWFVERPTVKRAILHGIASGLVIAIRVGLLFLPLYTLLFLGIRALAERGEGKGISWKRHCALLGAYGISFALAVVTFWPLLWEHPFLNLLAALQNMLWEQQPPGGFYLGEQVGTPPWHWVPMHIITKTPLLYTALLCVAFFHLVIATWKKPRSLLTKHQHTLLLFLWFLLPIITVIFLHATLFDEWRHLYFIYPALVLLAVSALRTLWNALETLRPLLQRALRAVVIVLCTGSFLGTALWMVQNHPLQYVYFSLPSRFIEGKFELDYWGLSFRQGFEWILAHDPSDLISVGVTSSPGWEALNILTKEQRRRLVVERVQAENNSQKYVLDNFRWTRYRAGIPKEFQLHSIKVSGMDVLGIYRNPLWIPERDQKAKRMEDFEVELRFDPHDPGFFEE